MIPASTCSISSFPHSYTSLYRRIILEYLSFLRWAAVCILYPIAHLPVQPFCRILIDCLLLFGGGPNLFARLPVGAFHHTVTVVVNYRVGTKIAATIGAAAQRDFIGTEHLKLPYGQCGQQSFFGVAYGNVAIDVGFDLGFATSLSTEDGKSEQFPFRDTQSLRV